jgi:hypothetical protein
MGTRCERGDTVVLYCMVALRDVCHFLHVAIHIFRSQVCSRTGMVSSPDQRVIVHDHSQSRCPHAHDGHRVKYLTLCPQFLSFIYYTTFLLYISGLHLVPFYSFR